MKALASNRLALFATVAILADCSGSQSSIGVPSAPERAAAHGSKTFDYTGGEQQFQVPRGVTQLTIVARGASGPSGKVYYCLYEGGNGGVIRATVPVLPEETLAVFVGGEGSASGPSCSGGGAGGFNGGGNGGTGVSGGYANGTGGGGASDVREGGDALTDRILVAGGGGGGGETDGGYGAGKGGAGGGEIGRRGGSGYMCSPAGHGGKGGTQEHGGSGGRGGQRNCSFQRGGHGHRGLIGVGGDGGGTSGAGGGGGGGGGGYYGGGGGGGGSASTSGIGGGGGGGGGSSYAEPNATRVKNHRGAAPAGNGSVVIFW